MRARRLGPLLRRYRAKHGIKQNTMATMLNVSKAQLSKIETMKHEPKGDLALSMLELLVPGLESDILLLEVEAENGFLYC